ncbi:MAG: hypothetical protein H6745_32280, partial [Deltaproteobacteria bacterium]|nr:hypothetical protein [Deltaproteobacteria bacterium]
MGDDKTILELSVEDFGRVKRADLRLKPLTLLVGENNTGKSWLASLVWGLFRFGGQFGTQSDSLEEARLLIEQRAKAAPSVLSANDQVAIVDALSAHASSTIGSLVRRILGETASIGTSSVRYRRGASTDIAVTVPFREESPAFGLSLVSEPFSLTPPALSRWETSAHAFLEVAMGVAVGAPFALPEPLYLPASRTGFVLLLERIVSEGLRSLGPAPRQPAALTAPMIEFVEWLSLANFEGKSRPPGRLRLEKLL